MQIETVDNAALRCIYELIVLQGKECVSIQEIVVAAKTHNQSIKGDYAEATRGLSMRGYVNRLPRGWQLTQMGVSLGQGLEWQLCSHS